MNNSDAKIVIDAGHGGTDVGASGNGIIEKDLTLAISNYMYDRFRELGIPVVMTRTTDETLTPSERTTRSKNAFGANRDVVLISNHINAGGAGFSYRYKEKRLGIKILILSKIVEKKRNL